MSVDRRLDMSALGGRKLDLSVQADVARIEAAQHPGGAYPAGPGFSHYQQSWLRDGAFIAYAMDRAGKSESALRFHQWVAGALTPLGNHVDDLIARRSAGQGITEFDFLPARFTVAGEWLNDGWPNFQLDGYGQWLWSLAAHLRCTSQTELPTALAPAVELVVRYLQHFWAEPCYDSWEEHRSQLHTSTLASVHAGLRDIAAFVPDAAPMADSALDLILEQCVSDGHFVKYVRNHAVDASLLWLATPFGVVSTDHPVMAATAERIENELVSGGGVRRYLADTYYGGGEWILLTAWLAWHWLRVAREHEALALLAWIEAQRDEVGSLPEQVPGSHTHPRFLEHWTRSWGPSAKPLLWSHAMVVLVKLEVEALQKGKGLKLGEA